MSLAMDRQPRALPKRLPAGTVYVVEGRGGDLGNLRVSSRYVVMPSGEKVKIPLEPARTAIRVSHRLFAGRQRSGSRASEFWTGTKKFSVTTGTRCEKQR